MTSVLNKVEEILTDFNSANNIPYDFERFNCDISQLPDTFITYFLVDDPAISHYDGKETAHEPKIQVSLFYRNKSTALTIPDLIVSAFLNAGFTRAGQGRTPYQNSTGHYGWRCDFNLYEKRGN